MSEKVTKEYLDSVEKALSENMEPYTGKFATNEEILAAEVRRLRDADREPPREVIFDRLSQAVGVSGPDEVILQQVEYHLRHDLKVVRVTEQKFTATPHANVESIPMLLWCPACNYRHIDEGDFAERLHHTHACQSCGMVWRPAVQHTVGVKFLPGFKS